MVSKSYSAGTIGMAVSQPASNSFIQSLNYHVAGKASGVFNLAIWQFADKMPN